MMSRQLALLVSLVSTGCFTLDLARTHESQKLLAEYGYVAGSVRAAEPADAWMVVLIAATPCDEDWGALRDAVARGENPAESEDPKLRGALARAPGKLQLVSHVLLRRPGTWYASLAPGCYGVGAFVDLNRDYKYSDEPALNILDLSRMIELAAGQRVDLLDLVIPSEGRLSIDSLDPIARQTRDLAARSQEDQTFVSLDAVAVAGEVVDLADPHFGEESGRLGFYDVHSFAWKNGPGVYFLEPYDPAKIPVLFVHGALG